MTDAKSFFNNPQVGNPLAGVKPPYRQNQFGGSLGGPIIKNKAFFFADYEGLKVTQGLTQLVTMPSACEIGLSACGPLAAPQVGNFSDLIPAGQNCTSRIQSRVAFLTPPHTWYPTTSFLRVRSALFRQIMRSCTRTFRLRIARASATSALTCNFISSPAYNQSSKTGDARVDYRFNDKDSIFGRYTINDVSTNWPSFLPNVTIGGISVAPGGQPNVGGGIVFPRNIFPARAKLYAGLPSHLPSESPDAIERFARTLRFRF